MAFFEIVGGAKAPRPIFDNEFGCKQINSADGVDKGHFADVAFRGVTASRLYRRNEQENAPLKIMENAIHRITAKTAPLSRPNGWRLANRCAIYIGGRGYAIQ